MNIKYLLVVSLTIFFGFSKSVVAQDTNTDLISIDAFSDDDDIFDQPSGSKISNFSNDGDIDDDDIDNDDDDVVIGTESKVLQNASPMRGIYTDEFLYRWYISAGVGAQFLMGEDDSKGKFTKRQTIAPSITVGYRFNPAFGVRLNITGGSLHGYNDGHSGTYSFWKKNDAMDFIGKEGYPTLSQMGGAGTSPEFIREAMSHWDPQWNYLGFIPDRDLVLDRDNIGWNWAQGGPNGGLYRQTVRYLAFSPAVTMNLFNLFGGHDDSRKFDMSMYLGPSIYHVMAHRGMLSKTGFGANGGIQAQYHISNNIGIFTEFSGFYFPDDFDGHKGGDKGDLVGQAVLGVTYKFASDIWSRPVVKPAAVSMEEEDDMNDELNRLRAELMAEMGNINDLQPEVDRLRAQLAEMEQQKAPEPEPEPEVEIGFLPDAVHFQIGKSDIDGEGWTIIERVAAYLNNNPDASVIITGYADKKTGTDAINERLSKERSKKVADALVYRYNISQGRVSVDWRGDAVQPFYKNQMNRAVLFYIEFDE